MDEGCSRAVRETFCELYDKGLIYKGSRIINWCPHCITALSDAEVEYVDKPGHLWYIRYPLTDGSGDLVVATTRPETMMGDTGVAVNPEDERFKDLVGKTCILPIMNREIPIVADDYVELGFGTGAVKMTPAHDPNDFEVGLRHNLEVIRCIGDDGKINENGGPYNGMDRYECRRQIVKDLEEQGYLVKTEPYSHNVGTCYRCHNDVEPLISAQWFVKMEPLAKEALRVVREGEVKFVPERFSKTYTNWMENVHDWCISRQLWWGHQIPAWYCDDCGHINVSREDPTKCEKCGSTHLTRDPDVLDTWFSSALWPFSTLGWPDQTKDLDFYYPTSVMVTGYDIIFFWVARMIFSGCEQMHKIPFHTVLIHGLVRDDKGRKMSKSLGNGIDPLEMAEKYGADALRFNLITGNSPGNDTRFYTEKCEAMRNFANKIWNASRFVMMNLRLDKCQLPAADALAPEDKWVLSKLNTLVKEVTENLDAYEIGVASAKVYDFLWDTYCDWYIELTKSRLQGEDEDAKLVAQNVLCYVLTELLKLLHPFMPFITEEIYQALPHEDKFIMTSRWPEVPAGAVLPGRGGRHGGRHGHHQGHPGPPGRDERAPLPEGGGADCHCDPGHLCPGQPLHPAPGLRQRREIRRRRSGGCVRHGDRRHPQRHGLSAPAGAGGHRRRAGADCQGDREGPKRPAERGAEALQREVRLPCSGGGGERRAGEGCQVSGAHRKAGGVRQSHAGVMRGPTKTQ